MTRWDITYSKQQREKNIPTVSQANKLEQMFKINI